MKTTFFLALAGLALAGCASTAPQDGSPAVFDETYTPTGSHIARKNVDRNNGVQVMSKEELQRSLEASRAAVNPNVQ